MTKNYYDILGLNKNATSDEIKKKYRELALRYHPDRNPGDKTAEEKFKEVAEAYSVLGDENKRKEYDNPSTFNGSGSWYADGSFDDIFNSWSNNDFSFHGFNNFWDNDMFGMFNSNKHESKKMPEKGADIRIKFKCTTSFLYVGGKKEIVIRKNKKCEHCNGTGKINCETHTCTNCNGTGKIKRRMSTILGNYSNVVTCDECNGTGKISTKPCNYCNGAGVINNFSTISIDIPKGMANGESCIFYGLGNAGKYGGKYGNLIVVIDEENDTKFTRDKSELTYNKNIDIFTALLGGTITIPTMTNDVKIKLEPGVQPGKVLRLKGKGMPIQNSSQYGDMKVVINVEIPTNISKEAKNKIEELKQIVLNNFY